ncbi:hypothetical protein BACCIP111899_02568 [Bacillus rhizoplanae]|uniref:Uncharacterized protein n=1 Tax=Bacillus rhizoplanae TaxID=2880966 RepID=A0ABM8YC81_9BACI|nr:hypothetical protein BACCIP111899_02568 [Bacillus rhizoplanae]
MDNTEYFVIIDLESLQVKFESLLQAEIQCSKELESWLKRQIIR